MPNLDPQQKVNVLLPVKAQQQRKQRLSSLLNSDERIAFTQAMLRDILCELKKSTYIEHIYLVGDKDDLSAIAAEFSVDVFSSFYKSRNLNSDLNAATDFLCEQAQINNDNVQSLLILHADIPLLKVAVLDNYISNFFQNKKAQLITDKASNGTNAFIFSMQAKFSFQYGNNSCAKHTAALKKIGVAYEVLSCEDLSFDIDTEQDFLQLMNILKVTNTESYLRDFLKAYQADMYKVKEVV